MRVGAEVENPTTVRLSADSTFVFELNCPRRIRQGYFVDFEEQAVQFKVRPGTPGSDGVGLKQQGILQLVGQQQSHQPDIRPHIDQRALPHVRPQVENVARVGNPRVQHGGRHMAVGIGAKSQSVEQPHHDRLAHRPLPQLPAEKQNKTSHALAAI